MQIKFSPPDITEAEIQEVANALRSGWITTGPRTKEFERRIAAYCHTEKAAALNSATAAMELSLRMMGIGEGDEVITTAYTYTATASCICHTGATPVLVDTLPDSFEMDPKKVRAAFTERTKAVICVDLAGIVYGHYDEIFKIAEEKKSLFHPANERQKILGRALIMADAAHAFGAECGGKACGEIADITCFSFHAVKNLTTAEGGAAVWRLPFDAEEVYKDYMLLSLHGQSKDALAKNQPGAWEYDVVAPYYKCNMTDITAALGLVQLERYPGILARRKQIISYYDEELRDYPVEHLCHYGETFSSSGHLYLTNVKGTSREKCNEIITKMAEAGVSTNVHYKPLPMLTAYKNMGFSIEDYPNAYAKFTTEITLPLHTCLTDEEMEYVAETYKNVLKECGLC